MRRGYVEYMGERYPTNNAPINILALEVIEGKFGHGELRKYLLGSKYDDVQAEVNKMLHIDNQKSVIEADWMDF